MALTKFVFTPGLVKDDTPLASEGGWVDCDKIRFNNGYPEVLGGWEAVTSSTFTGIVRGSHSWNDLLGRRNLAFGTAAKLYALVGGTVTDITPPHSEGVLSGPFTTVSGTSSVSVAHSNHGFSTGMSVTFANQSATVGGLTLNGTYTITVSDINTYLITAAGTAGSSATGGGNVDYSAVLPAGLVDGLGEPGGYGTGSYGAGGYGTTAATAVLPRIWFLDNWGETLVALPRGGALYQWQPSLTYPELVTGGSFASSAGWTTGTGWSIGAGVATATAGTGSSLSSAVAFNGGYVYRVTATVTRSAGSVVIRTDAGTIGDASAAISVSGTYSRLFRAPAGSTQIQFLKDTTFAGTIDNVSVKLENIAYRVDEAPPVSDAMFVDPHQIIVLMGTSPYGEVYNPLAIRWCDRQDLTAWVPSVTNLAGDNILARGGRIIGGIATRQQNLIWTDAALYTMQFTGSETDVYLFNLAGMGCGLLGAMAMAEHNGVVFWASNSRNFYSFNGALPMPIECRIRNDFFDNISTNQAEKVACGILPEQLEVWWLKPDSRDGSECSRYAAHRWDELHWTAGTHARSDFVQSGVYEYPIMFGTDGRLYYHEKGHTANGGVISAYIESAYFDVGDGENLMMVRRIVGDFEDLVSYVNFMMTARPWPTGTETVYGPFTHTPSTQKLDMRVTARQLKLLLASVAAPLQWRLGSFRLDIAKTGQKR